jgi:hypothetical protein
MVSIWGALPIAHMRIATIATWNLGGMIVQMVPIVCLFRGYAWARWVVSAYLLLPWLYVLWRARSLPNDPYFLGACTLCFFMFVCIFAILNRRETRDWLRLAARLRAEQREWRSATYE